MSGRKLTRTFFARPTFTAAKELLGKFLVRKIGRKVVRVIITETEAYCGLKDLASHASRGRTKRTEIMFGSPGFAYVYLIYGMYYCLNIVTEAEGYPAAVLIRGAKIAPGDWRLVASDYSLVTNINGPGKLCRFLKIDKTLNGEDLIKSKRLWVERGIELKPKQIGKSKRIGIDYAGSCKHKLWRFFIRSKS